MRVSGRMIVHPSAKIRHCSIKVDKDSCLEIAEGVKLTGVKIRLSKGSTLRLAPYSELRKNTNALAPQYLIEGGRVTVGHHSSLRAARVWVRFGGQLDIGCYVSINDGSEIRADEYVSIGDYGMISYNTRIWDTNTHTIYSEEARAEIKRKHWPEAGYEYEKPKTAPVHIGPGAWIGESAIILKGCRIGRDCIIGTNTLLSNKNIDDHKIVVQKTDIIVLDKSQAEKLINKP